jgi:agmatine/peptidylarginine deiminase
MELFMIKQRTHFSRLTKKTSSLKVGLISLAITAAFSLTGCNSSDGSVERSPQVTPPSQVTPQPATKAYVPANRVAAEWEPAIGAVVGWPLVLPEQLLVDIAKKDLLFVILGSDEEEEEAFEKFTELGIDEKQLRFIVHPNAINGDFAASAGPQWTRDWGPFSQFDKNGDHHLADPLFMGYPLGSDACDGELDVTTLYQEVEDNDEVVEELAAELGVAHKVIPLHITGGNIMFDGKGTAMITCLTVKENEANGISLEELKSQLKELLGIDTFHVIPNFEDYGIQHIDCLLKFVSEDTVLIARPPESSHLFERYEKIVAIVSKLKTNSGLPYKVLRIEAGATAVKGEGSDKGEDGIAAYTNSLILNNRVFVPLFGIDTDQQALETWRKAMPGYEVTGYEYSDVTNPESPFRSFDALHCRTRAIWDSEMLYMTHNELTGTVAAQDKYSVDVTIKDYSNAGLVSGSLTMKWRVVGTDTWNDIPLVSTEKTSVYTADITGVKSGQSIEYYMMAADNAGRKESLPRSAPAAYYSFKIKS